MKKAEKIFIDIAQQLRDCNDIKDRIRSLCSCGELTSEEYDYILSEWDTMLAKYNL